MQFKLTNQQKPANFHNEEKQNVLPFEVQNFNNSEKKCVFFSK